MWYPEAVTTAPQTEPVSLVEVKRHVHAEDFTDDDGYLSGLIAAARGHVESYCGASFAAQSVEATCTSWSDFCHVPFGPIAADSIEISYIDSEGVEQVLAGTVYELRGQSIVLKYGQQWPGIQSGSLIVVDADVGGECPPAVKHAMLLWIASAYGMRGSGEQPEWTSFDALLSNHRYY